MIQLASDPTASRVNWRPATVQGKETALRAPRGRSGHAWPFLSRYVDKPVAQQQTKPSSDHGS